MQHAVTTRPGFVVERLSCFLKTITRPYGGRTIRRLVSIGFGALGKGGATGKRTHAWIGSGAVRSKWNVAEFLCIYRLLVFSIPQSLVGRREGVCTHSLAARTKRRSQFLLSSEQATRPPKQSEDVDGRWISCLSHYLLPLLPSENTGNPKSLGLHPGGLQNRQHERGAHRSHQRFR